MTRLRTIRTAVPALIGVALLALLSACASSSQRESPPTVRTSVTPVQAGSPAATPEPGTSAVAVTGPIKASVLSLAGPYDPAGPVLGRSVDEVLMGLRKAASAGRPVTCAKLPCWSGVAAPAGSLLLAVRPGPVSCYSPRTVAVTPTGSDALRVDIQSMGVCRPGAGSAARMPAMLIALPGSALPSSGNVTVTVRLSTNTGVAFSPLGTAGFTLG